MSKDRQHYTAKEKVTILRKHLIDHVPVSQLCDEYRLQPTVFYRWQKQFFENGEAAFAASAPKANNSALEQKVATLEEKLQRKHEVLSELMEEHIQLKKSLGES
ncbi:MAG: transposase [Acidobacteriaceae bacterium]|nr:transposase [Acidobacteriaceae bacterium]